MAFGHFFGGSHHFMVTALGSCVKWPEIQWMCNFYRHIWRLTRLDSAACQYSLKYTPLTGTGFGLVALVRFMIHFTSLHFIIVFRATIFLLQKINKEEEKEGEERMPRQVPLA